MRKCAARHPTSRQKKSRMMEAWYQRGGLAVLNMLHALLKERDDMLIVDVVIDFFAIPPGLHHAHLAQTTHMVGNGRLTDSYHLCQRGGVHFT